MQNLGLIEDGSVLVRDGVITHVGPTRRIENLSEARAAEVYDAHGKVVMPAFIDCHTLLGNDGTIPCASDPKIEPMETPSRPAGGPHSAMVREIRPNTARQVEYRISCVLELLASHGTGTVGVKLGFGPDEGADAKLLRCYQRLNQNPLGIVSSLAIGHSVWPEFSSVDEHADWFRRQHLPRLTARGSKLRLHASCTKQGWNPPEMRATLALAKRLGVPVTLEAGSGPGSASVEMGLDQGVRCFSGLEHASEDDVLRAGAAGAISVLTPGRAFFNGAHKLPDVRGLIEAGAAPVLSTGFDFKANPLVNMQMLISLSVSHLHMTAPEAITACTFNAAHALGLSDRLGSIESGKQADLIILNVSDYREMAYYYGANVLYTNIPRGEVAWQLPSSAAASA